VNPVSNVSKYKERAPKIRFFTLPQIEEQLRVLEEHSQLQTMVAVLIYVGLRREEVLWLTFDDIDLEFGTYGLIRVRAKTVHGESWQPKTKSNRAVPISSPLRLIVLIDMSRKLSLSVGSSQVRRARDMTRTISAETCGTLTEKLACSGPVWIFGTHSDHILQ